jgi:predicted transcriptional regulator
MSISESEILDAIREATVQPNVRPEGAFTVRELATAWGMEATTVQRRLRPLVAAGKMECVRVSLVDMSGRSQPSPAYRLTATPTKKAKR